MKFNQYKSKLTPVTDSIDQMMGNIARSWLLMYFTFFTREELEKMGIKAEDKFDDKGKFLTILINGIDIMEIIDERNVKFTFNSLSKLTKENSRATITQNLGPILQYAGPQVDIDQIMKILLGQDFDPDKVVKSPERQAEEARQRQYAEQQAASAQQLTTGQPPVPSYQEEEPAPQEDPSGMNEQQILDEISNITS